MTFRAKLFRFPGPGGWTFAPIPERHAPPVTQGWGRTPVLARVDGTAWETSVWRDKVHGTLLPVPKHVRQGKGDGDFVRIELSERRDGEQSATPRPSSRRGVQSGASPTRQATALRRHSSA